MLLLLPSCFCGRLDVRGHVGEDIVGAGAFH